jgi:NAD(P)-dependent dehydrogenase (short-subunit alcohol dehydrogenase family)
VRDAFDVEEVIGRIAAQHSRLDGLIAGAAIQKVTPALEYPPSAISEMMEINYKGVYISAVACAKQMIKYRTPGSILLIASMSGLIANRYFTSSVYNSSKAAVIQLTRSLAMEWGQIIDDGKGGKLPIRVNALCPGNIVTPMVEKNFEDDPSLEQLWKDLNMMGRLSRPREYRGAALFALSDASSFVSGVAW